MHYEGEDSRGDGPVACDIGRGAGHHGHGEERHREGENHGACKTGDHNGKARRDNHKAGRNVRPTWVDDSEAINCTSRQSPDSEIDERDREASTQRHARWCSHHACRVNKRRGWRAPRHG